jgi:hypothetical protein
MDRLRLNLKERAEVLRTPGDTLLTSRQVAFVLGVTHGTVRRWNTPLRQGGLRPFVKRAGRNLYGVEDVRRWLGLDQADGRRQKREQQRGRRDGAAR